MYQNLTKYCPNIKHF